LQSSLNHKTYKPDEVKIIDFYRFEGQSDPADNAIMYVIEANDGDKGTLIDAYGAYADENVNRFISKVKNINKQRMHRGHHDA
jgi:mannose/fructose-specific phosphotransferase system component IIA